MNTRWSWFLRFPTFSVIKCLWQINGWGKKIPSCCNSALVSLKFYFASIFFFSFSDAESICTDCRVGPSWLLYLCIAFGILFLVMLIIVSWKYIFKDYRIFYKCFYFSFQNVFLCSAMTCSCARTESNFEGKEPSIVEEFDPYTRSWQGSQYGSR